MATYLSAKYLQIFCDSLTEILKDILLMAMAQLSKPRVPKIFFNFMLSVEI